MKQNKKEELQSRREFFKKAAKTALPILGAIALANVPLVSNAMSRNDCNFGCVGGCSGGCASLCKDSCRVNCYTTCVSSCGRGSKYY